MSTRSFYSETVEQIEMKCINKDSFSLLSHHCNIFITVTFTCITQDQISYPGTSPENTEPEPSLMGFQAFLLEIWAL